MKNKLTFFTAPAIILCWCLFSIQSCKDPVIQSKNLLTKSDTLNLAKDTLSIKCSTVLQNMLNTTGVIDGMVGSMNDHNFGVTYAGFYAQFILTSLSPAFGTRPILDSVVLSLLYDAPYGSCSKPMNVYVYELNQDIISTASYYSNNTFKVKTPPLGQLTNFVPDFYDSVYVYESGGNQAPQMRIQLSKDFGYRLLNANVNTTLASSDSFLTQFKGLYVTAAGPVGNGIINCNLSSAITAVTLYYRNTETGDSVENAFNFLLSGVTVNHTDNNYFGAAVNSALQNSSGTGSQKLFLQGGGGLHDKILLNIDTLKKMNVGINKAELILALSQPDSLFTVPTALNLLYIDDAGVGQTIEDATTTTFGGYLQTDTVNGAIIDRYHFNISIYMQRLLQGIHNNNGLYLEIPAAATTPARVVLTNPQPGSVNYNIYRTYMMVTYTKL